MNRWRLLVLIIVFLITAVGVRQVLRKHRTAANAQKVEAAFAKYSADLRPGMTRREVKEYFRTRGIDVRDRGGYEPGGPESVLVQVGEEEVPWYCSEWPDYVAFEFAAAPPSKTSDSDVLKLVHVTSNGEGCL